MSFKPIDAKRDEYRKYLERTGVLELLSKVFIKLFECPDKPENAIDFIRKNMGDAMLETDTIEHLKRELEDARNEVAQLKRSLENLKLENSKCAAVDVAVTTPAEANTISAEVVIVPVESEAVAATVPAVEESKAAEKVAENVEQLEIKSAAAGVDEEKKDVAAEIVEESATVEEQNEEQITEPTKAEITPATASSDKNNEESNQQDTKVDPQKETESKTE